MNLLGRIKSLTIGFVCVLATGLGAQPFEDTMAQRVLACTACHGDQGRAGPDGYYPRLAGKPAAYLYNQLINIREGRRHYAPMATLLDTLDDGYLQAIANHFSEINLPYPTPRPAKVSPDVLARGKAIAINGDVARKLPACIQCHGQKLTGTLPATPGLLGLPSDYLNAQLGGWKTGQRKANAPDCMAHIASLLSDQEISAVSSWLSSQPVPENHAPAPMTGESNIGKLQCGNTTPNSKDSLDQSTGAYLARIGNCASCHTARGGTPFAGGRGIQTPFGTVYSTNLTPDKVRGIGAWTAEDFWQALHHGKSRDGRLLNPAFPYTSYTHVAREDSDAIWAYLRTLPPSPTENRPHALRWPFGSQFALWTWRQLYFTPSQQPNSSRQGHDALTQRGAYLVEGLGHCIECHAQRNALGAITSTGKGGTVSGSLWYAPSLYSAEESMINRWTVPDIAMFLKTGRNDHARAMGPMAEVVAVGTQHLTEQDAYAIASYLKSRSAPPSPVPVIPQESVQVKNTAWETSRGVKLYETHCAQCHGKSGLGRANAYPALAGNPAVSRTPTNNLILKVLHGGFGPSTAGNPKPFGMPPFLLSLSDAEIAAILTYIRNAWGNSGAAVSEFDINRVRASSNP